MKLVLAEKPSVAQSIAKVLGANTKMRNVAGLSTSEAQKSSDMFMKCRYMDEVTGG